MASDKARIAKLEKELELLRAQSEPRENKGHLIASLKTEKGAIIFTLAVFALASLLVLAWPETQSEPKQNEPVGRWENVCTSELNPNWYEGASGLVGPQFYTRCDDIFIKN